MTTASAGELCFVVPTPDVLPRLLALARAYHAESGTAWSAAVQGRALGMLCAGDPVALGWLLVADRRDVGYIVCCLGFSVEFGGYDSFIDELYVVPNRRRRGFARRALGHAIAELAARGVRAVHLQVERGLVHAQALYRQTGFVGDERFLLTKRIAGT